MIVAILKKQIVALSLIGFQCEWFSCCGVRRNDFLIFFLSRHYSVLIGYVIFAIADTVFHITPSQPYNEILRDAVTGIAAGGGDAASP